MEVQYIDYFSSKKPVPEGYIDLSIAKGTPPWWKSSGKWNGTNKCDVFAPEWYLVEGFRIGNISEDEYTRLYIEDLYQRQDALNAIVEAIKDGGKFVFKCHCSKGKFCHRYIVKQFLEQFGIEVREL